MIVAYRDGGARGDVDGGAVDQSKVLIVDDQTLYREGLRGLMDHWQEFLVVGDAPDGESAVAFCLRQEPDLVLMDVQMPGMGGVEAVRRIHAAHPDVRIVMLTVSADHDDLIASLCAGAVGYILKDLPSSQLRSYLRGVVNGDYVISGSVASAMVERAMLPQVEALSQGAMGREGLALTERETEVLKRVARGLSNDEIGAEMYISPGTVKKTVQSLMQKLGMDNRVMLAVYAIRAGIAK